MSARAASELDWAALPNFAPAEFPAGVLEHVRAELIEQVQAFREDLGSPMLPSPLEAGWVRRTGSPAGRHYVGGGRLSDAGDLFIPHANIAAAWLLAQEHGFGGIGVYLDTIYGGRAMPMMHFDLRPRRLLWLRVSEAGRQRYIYPSRGGAERREFLSRLASVA